MPPNPPQGHRYVPREDWKPVEERFKDVRESVLAAKEEFDAVQRERDGLCRAIHAALEFLDKPPAWAQTARSILLAARRGEYPP
jgi:hypothetical protein